MSTHPHEPAYLHAVNGGEGVSTGLSSGIVPVLEYLNPVTPLGWRP